MDAVTAQVLAALILTSTQGADRLESQLPLHAIDRGGSWLVKGSSSVDPILKLNHCIFSVFLDKSTAQVLAIDFSGRPQLSDDQKKYWHKNFRLRNSIAYSDRRPCSNRMVGIST